MFASAQPDSVQSRIFFGRDGLRAGWSLLLFLSLVAALSWMASGIAHHLQPHHGTVAGSELTPSGVAFQDGILFLTVALSTFAMSKIEGRPMRVYGLSSSRGELRHFLTGLLWAVGLLSLLVFALSQAHLLVFTGRLLSGSALLRFALEWFGSFLLVGLFEEYSLRGYVQFTLARGFAGTIRALSASPRAPMLGFWMAATLLSFVFGFSHQSTQGESPLGLLSAGLIGLVFCLSLWRTGSLWWAIGFHAAWDWAQSFLYGVPDSGTIAQFHLLGSHPQGSPLLSGGSTGPEGSVLILPTIALIVAVVWLTLGRRFRGGVEGP